jgi:hypothetical protein
LYTIHAEKTNAVGGELAKIFASSEESPLMKILSAKVEVNKNNGEHQIKSLDDLKKVLTSSFAGDGSIIGCNSVYPDKQLGFFLQNARPLPTKLTLVARILVDCLENPELNKQLNPQERQLVTSYLDNLLAHPQAKASVHYRDTALQLLSPNTFEADTQFLQTVFENSVISPKLDALFEHPLLDGFATPENKALILPHLQEALSQLHANPAQFNPTDEMTAPELIVKRALELATKESTLTDFGVKTNFVSDTKWLDAGIATKKQAIGAVINNLNDNLGWGGRKTNTAKLYHESPRDSEFALFKILDSIADVAGLDKYPSSNNSLLTPKGFQDGIEFPLIQHFAELHFPEVIEKHRNDAVLRPRTISSSGLLGIMKEATEALAQNDPKKQKLEQAIANLRKLDEHIKLIVTSTQLTS